MKTIEESHLDHGLSFDHLDFVKRVFAGRDGFFIETVDLPDDLPAVPCGLHGPIVGDEPVSDAEAFYAQRGGRSWESRLCRRAPRQTRKVTVIAGPHGGDSCVLYTAFGGPPTPKEILDPSLSADQLRKSQKFWAEHALSSE